MKTEQELKVKEQHILTRLFRTKECLTKNKFDPIDLYIEYKDKIIIGEYKDRDFSHKTFDWILEKKKYESIINKQLPINNTKPVKYLYINTFTDGYILIWDLQQIFKKHIKESDWKWELLNETTVGRFKNSGKKVWKQVYLLDQEWSTFKIKYV